MGLIFRIVCSLSCKIAWILASIKWPYPLNVVVLGILGRLFGINMIEAEKPLSQYHSFQDVFTRQLRPNSRRIDAEAEVVSPADGRVMDTFSLTNERPIFIKGTEYNVQDLIQDPFAANQGVGINIYLAPYNYHRFVMPMAGVIEQVKHIPGAYFPVNPSLQFMFPKTFIKNERVVLRCNTDGKRWYMIMIAALNVGGIKLPWYDALQNPSAPNESTYQQNDHLFIQGEELGYFMMGSSIVLLFPDTPASELTVHKDDVVHFGQSILKQFNTHDFHEELKEEIR